MFDFNGQTVLVTGGSDGIGFAISQAFTDCGAHVILVGRNRDRLELARDQLGHDTETIAVDLARSDAAEYVRSWLNETDNSPTVLVNNAGFAQFLPLEETDAECFDAHFSINVRTPLLLTRSLLPDLERRHGSVINISSYFARRMLVDRRAAAYAASKGALESLTRALAFELGPRGVRVNAIAPGTVETTMVRDNLERLSAEARERFDTMIPRLYPLGRLGRPTDLCGAALFLASESAAWITGAVLSVDGGLTTH